MRIISWNVNGIRSAYKKGLLDFIKKENPNIFCLQEIKSNLSDIPNEITELKGYNKYYNTANKKGYSGVLVFSKEKPKKITDKLGLSRFDKEGRFLSLEFAKFTLINIYLPHGGRKKENLDYKLKVYTSLLNHIKRVKNKKVVLIGDFNVAHNEIDLARPKNNKNNIMFTKEEREQIDRIISLDFIDTFRVFNKKEGNYTWWPYFANARQRNIGWRIDYIFMTKNMLPQLKKAEILKEVNGSDHCPIAINLSD